MELNQRCQVYLHLPQRQAALKNDEKIQGCVGVWGEYSIWDEQHQTYHLVFSATEQIPKSGDCRERLRAPEIEFLLLGNLLFLQVSCQSGSFCIDFGLNFFRVSPCQMKLRGKMRLVSCRIRHDTFNSKLIFRGIFEDWNVSKTDDVA